MSNSSCRDVGPKDLYQLIQSNLDVSIARKFYDMKVDDNTLHAFFHDGDFADLFEELNINSKIRRKQLCCMFDQTRKDLTRSAIGVYQVFELVSELDDDIAKMFLDMKIDGCTLNSFVVDGDFTDIFDELGISSKIRRKQLRYLFDECRFEGTFINLTSNLPAVGINEVYQLIREKTEESIAKRFLDMHVDGNTLHAFSVDGEFDELLDELNIKSKITRKKLMSLFDNSVGQTKMRRNSSKFDTLSEYFIFGGDVDYTSGLTRRIPLSNLYRSMEEECLDYADKHPVVDGEGGVDWREEYNYVVRQPAHVKRCVDKPVIRDLGHEGMTLTDFANLPEARAAGLNLAEVAAIRLYTGPFYELWNDALRLSQCQDNSEQLNAWSTCITVLYSGLFKLGFSGPRHSRRMYRGVRETTKKIPDSFLPSQDSNSLCGGVEPAFMSTTPSVEAALHYCKRGTDAINQMIIFEFEFDLASAGANIQWCSQFPDENELLFPPCTYLTCISMERFPSNHPAAGIRRLKVRATICAMRNDVDCIRTVTDKFVPYSFSSSIQASPLSSSPASDTSSCAQLSYKEHISSFKSNSVAESSPRIKLQGEIPIKVVVVGDTNVGKTTLLNRIVQDKYEDESIPTVGPDIRTRIVEKKGTVYRIQFWDTAGQERFRSLTTSYYRETKCILLVYDISCRESFENIKNWIDEIERFAEPDTIKILVGNKSDLEDIRQIPEDRGKTFADSLGIAFTESSAKSSSNIDEIIMTVIAEVESKFADIADSAVVSETTKLTVIKTRTAKRKMKCC